MKVLRLEPNRKNCGQMVGLPDFRSHSKSGPFATQPVFDHWKSRLVWISDPQCIFSIVPKYLREYRIFDSAELTEYHCWNISLIQTVNRKSEKITSENAAIQT